MAVTLALSTGTVAFADDYPLKKCPVSGDAYGGDLGPPVDYSYKGRTIRLCCKACIKKFNKDPEKYLKILDDEIAKAKK